MVCEGSLSSADFNFVRSLARETAALVFEDDKEYLVKSRLTPVAEQEGFESLQALIHALRISERLSRLQVRAIHALTTNETLFFRDRYAFDALRDSVLPELIEARRDAKALSIWSAAASSGQEAYSVAMIVRDHFPELAHWNISIMGTDLCDKVLEQARSGAYAQHEVNRGMPPALLVRHFTQEGQNWVIKPEVRRMVQFRNMNLMGKWPDVPCFDLILIRNVLIYFDQETKRNILQRVAARLARDGYMAMGSAETPMMVTDLFKPTLVGNAPFYRLGV